MGKIKQQATPQIEPNVSRVLKTRNELAQLVSGAWIKQNTAILIIHGIGNQNPLETLDAFSRGLVAAVEGGNLTIEHRLAKKTESGSKTPWFDNYLRLTKDDQPTPYLDVFEYYWAAETEDQATFKDLNKWLSKTTTGARKFYERNVDFAKRNNDDSVFIKNGKFRSFNYWFCVNLIPSIFIFINWFMDAVFKLLTSIPIVGAIASSIAQTIVDGRLEILSNVLNDISIYNTVDAKSRFFRVRNCILEGSVNALKFLLEAKEDANETKLSFEYDRVLLAGHSLGSQIAFDTINRINHLVNQGEMKGYDRNGNSISDDLEALKISTRLVGLVTFGSPLDKIAFFLREQVPEMEYIRAQILNGFHGFKQRDWATFSCDAKVKQQIKTNNNRLFDDILWNNYWDGRDYVSGSLDYYKNVTNVDCKFPSKWHGFTHSYYWDCTGMFQEILNEFMIPEVVDGVREASDLVVDIEPGMFRY